MIEMKHNHNHKVNETRRRSLLKALSGYIFEVTVDTFIIGIGLKLLGQFETGAAFAGGFTLAAITEVLCFVSHYINDRLWNKVQWGRQVEDVEEEFDSNRIEHL